MEDVYPPDPYGTYNPFAYGPGAMRAGDPFRVNTPALQALGGQYSVNPYSSGMYGFPRVNIPQLGPMNDMATMGFSLFATPLAQQHGYTIGNFLGPEPNLGVAMRNRHEAQQMMQLMHGAGDRDTVGRQRLTQIMTGIAMRGGATKDDAEKYGAEQAQMVHSMALSPTGQAVLTVIGQQVGMDLLGTLEPEIALGRSVMQMGRGYYRGGGRFGLSAPEAAAMTQQLAQHYYPGGKFDSAAAHGFTAGRLGEIAAASQSMGLLPGLRSVDDLSPSERTEMTGAGGEAGLLEALGKANTKNLTDKLKGVTKMFRLASEITGSEDVADLVKTIQIVTGGGASQMDPSQIQTQLGRVQEIARAARMTMDQFLFIINEGGKLGEAAGLGRAAGSAAAITAIQDATVASGVLKREMAGQPNIYNVDDTTMRNEMLKRANSAMNSIMGQEVHGFAGVLAGLETRMGKEGFAAKAATLSPEQQELIATVRRVSEGNATPGDFEAYRTEEGRNRLAAALGDVAGLEPGEVRVMSQRALARQMGSRAFPNATDSVLTMGDAEDTSTVQRVIAGIRPDLPEDVRAKLASITLDLQPGTPAYRDAVAQLEASSGQALHGTLTRIESQLQQHPGFGDADAITAKRSRRSSTEDRASARAHMEGQRLVWGAISDAGLAGGDVLDRAAKAFTDRNSGDVEAVLRTAISGATNEEVKAAMEGPLNELKAIDAQLQDTAISPEQKAALSARRRGIRDALDVALRGAPAEAQKTAPAPGDDIKQGPPIPASLQPQAAAKDPNSDALFKLHAERFAEALKQGPALQVQLKDMQKDMKIAGTLKVTFEGASATGLLTAAQDAEIGAGGKDG